LVDSVNNVCKQNDSTISRKLMLPQHGTRNIEHGIICCSPKTIIPNAKNIILQRGTRNIEHGIICCSPKTIIPNAKNIILQHGTRNTEH